MNYDPILDAEFSSSMGNYLLENSIFICVPISAGA